MVKKLLIVMAAGAIVSFTCFFVVNLMGGGVGPTYWHDGRHADWAMESGPEISRDLPFTGAEVLEVGYPADIHVTQGPQARFTVRGPQGLIDALKLEGGSLSGPEDFGFHFGRHHRHGRLRIDVVSPNTHEFHLSGAEKLTLENFQQDSLILQASGAADVRGEGHARRLEAHISGAGHLNLGDLPVDEAEVSISGAGDAKLDPRQSADISISGAGNVRLLTRPPHLHTHISGFGHVDAPDDVTPYAPPASSTPAPAPAAPAQPPVKSKV